ncbi:MAG: hypothetical protein ACKV22_07305 [Bryobacteraceae bacterium]
MISSHLGIPIETCWAMDERSLAGRTHRSQRPAQDVVFFESTPLQWNNTWDTICKLMNRFGA